MRKLLLVIFSLLALPLVYIGALHLLPDEELSPLAAAWLKSDGAVLDKEENSYYLIWGIEAPVGVSMREYGEARVEKIVQVDSESLQHDLGDDDYYQPDGFDNGAQIDTEGMARLCELGEENCLDAYHSDAEFLFSQGDNALLLERYTVLSSLQHYQGIESMGINTPFPPFYRLISAQRLRHVSIASRYLKGERNEALEELAADLRFVRMLMAEADSLIVRMVAIRMMANDLHLYSQLLDKQDAAAVVQAIQAITPLSESERDCFKMFRGEFRFQAGAIAQLTYLSMSEVVGVEGGALSYLDGIFPINSNRILNATQTHFAKTIELGRLPPSQIKARLEQVTEELFMTPGLWNYLSDPVTSVLLSMAASDYASYLQHHHDLDGLIRLVRLKGLITEKSVSTEELDTFISTSSYASAYLQEEAPVRWDPEQQTLYFTPVNEASGYNLNYIFLNRMNSNEQ